MLVAMGVPPGPTVTVTVTVAGTVASGPLPGAIEPLSGTPSVCGPWPLPGDPLPFPGIPLSPLPGAPLSEIPSSGEADPLGDDESPLAGLGPFDEGGEGPESRHSQAEVRAGPNVENSKQGEANSGKDKTEGVQDSTHVQVLFENGDE